MRKVSKSNVYYTSDGKVLYSTVLEAKIYNAKRAKLAEFIITHGYFFCEDCNRNESCGEPIDLSHTISVKEAKESRRAELCYDLNNIKLRCRTCHRKHDKS